MYTYLEKLTTFAKILFADFTLAFNLTQRHIIAHTLIYFVNLRKQLVARIIDRASILLFTSDVGSGSSTHDFMGDAALFFR